MKRPTIAPELYEAYRSTRYCARIGKEELVLQVDSPSSPLKELMDEQGASSGCFITACNPFSEACDEATNAAANERLRHLLVNAGWRVFEGEGRGSDDGWPAEPSFLVLGCTRNDAIGLCEAFGQNAVLWFGADAMPVLLFHPALEKR